MTVRHRMLDDLVAPLRITERFNYANVPVSCITDDSREVDKGALFVAVPGEVVDGHRFVLDAARSGASAIICRDLPAHLPRCPLIRVPDCRIAISAVASVFFGRAAEQICVIGATGTDGKTTTTELIRLTFAKAGLSTGSLGTVTYNLGDRVLESGQTTPHPLVLHAMLREMADAGITHVSMEVSSHALVHHRTAHVPFRAAVLTNVTEDHLDFHRSPEAYLQAKQMLFESLGPDAFAILNARSPACEPYSRAAAPARVITYGLGRAAQVRGQVLSVTVAGMEVAVHTPRGSYRLRTPLTGGYNAENVLAAAAVAFALGLPVGAVQSALKSFRGVPGRLERVSPPGMPTVIVDYAHTPNALKTVLTTLRPLTKGRLVCVFGCGGNRERQKRPAMGSIAAELADFTVITSDNSRNEATEDIIAEIVGGIQTRGIGYMTEPDRARAIEEAIGQATSPDDVVVICGRGCERVQTLGDQRLLLDDRIVARQILADLRTTRKKSA